MGLGSVFLSERFNIKEVDRVIVHGAEPSELAPMVEAYRAIRPAGRFDHLSANPGL